MARAEVEQSAQKQLILPLRAYSLRARRPADAVVIAGLAFVSEEEMEAERAALCRAALLPSGGAPGAALRAHAELAGDGRPAVKVQRPRARSVDGRCHRSTCASWQAWRCA